MALIEAGFIKPDGTPDVNLLRHHGPTVIVNVGPFKVPHDPKDFKIINAHALVDTGATLSMIDEALAQDLGLIPIDKVPISGVSGIEEHICYMAAILIPSLGISQFGKFTAAKLTHSIHNVLLGRDFLSKTIMIYDGVRGQVTIASAQLTNEVMRPSPLPAQQAQVENATP